MRKLHALLALTLLPASLWATTITGQIQIRVGISTLTGYAGAKVVLFNGTGSNAQPVDSTTSDSTGQYTFSNVTTGAKQLTASAANFQDTTRTVFIRNANRTSTVNLELKRVTGILSGTVRSNAPDSAGIPNAKVLCLGMMNSIQVIDSVLTDSLGNYSVSLPAGSYGIRISAVGFKSTVGQAVLDTTASILLNGFTTLNVNLAPARSTITGTIQTAFLAKTSAQAASNPYDGSNAKVLLQRRKTDADTFVTLDSTVSDSNSAFKFSNLIAATGGSGGTYRLIASKQNFDPGSGSSTVKVGIDSSTSITLFLVGGGAILSLTHNNSYGIRFSRLNNQLVLSLFASNIDRTSEIFDLSGRLRQQVDVQPGESRVFLSASYAPEKGFLFLMK